MLDVFKKRRSIRSYLKKEVEKEKIGEIIKAINSAPSAGNLQAFKAYYTTNKEKIKKIAECCYQEFIAKAPLLFVFFARPEISSSYYGERGELYSIQDATIACAFAMLEATNQGLASCWIGAFDEKCLSSLFNETGKPIALLVIGYGKEKARERERENRVEEIE